MYLKYAEIAQLVEQWTENPRVSSSNLDFSKYKLVLNYYITKYVFLTIIFSKLKITLLTYIILNLKNSELD